MLLGAYYGTGSTSVSNGSGALGEKGDRCTSLSCESISEALGRPCRGITHSDLRASPSLVLLRPRCIQHPPDATPCTLRASQRAGERAHVHACSHSCTITLRASHSAPPSFHGVGARRDPIRVHIQEKGEGIRAPAAESKYSLMASD